MFFFLLIYMSSDMSLRSLRKLQTEVFPNLGHVMQQWRGDSNGHRTAHELSLSPRKKWSSLPRRSFTNTTFGLTSQVEMRILVCFCFSFLKALGFSFSCCTCCIFMYSHVMFAFCKMPWTVKTLFDG